MTIDPNTIINSPAPALFLALIILGLFVTGIIVPGKSVDAITKAKEVSDTGWRLTIGELTTALERKNDIDAARLEWERQHEERRSSPRPTGE